MNNSKELILTLEKGVRIIELNRPASKNAFNSYFYETIAKTLNQDAENPEVIATIITGKGDYYSSGFDMKVSANTDLNSQLILLKNMINAFVVYPKLLIALINGPAIGIGVTTAALCDVVYASERATFETPFVKIGLCAEGCSSYTFSRILGRSKASEMLLMGHKMTAREALDFRFVSKVIPGKKWNSFFVNLKKLGALPLHSIVATKKLMMKHNKDILCECNAAELKELQECFSSEEFSNAMVQFMNKKNKSKL